MTEMTNAQALAWHGCAVCFKAVYDPTDEEARRGTCQDCDRRQMDAAVEYQYPDALEEDDQ